MRDTSRSSNAANDAAVWKDKYVRLLADFDNHRKREAKLQAMAIADAKQDLLFQAAFKAPRERGDGLRLVA